MLQLLLPLIAASLTPWFVIAAGIGLFFLGWLYGRLSGRQRETGKALVAQMDATQALGAHLQTTEQAIKETEARVVPKLGEIDRLRAEVDQQTPKVEEARATLLGITTRIGTLEDRLAEASRQSLEAREAAKVAGERAGRDALQGLSETLMGHKAESEAMLSTLAERLASLEATLAAAGTPASSPRGDVTRSSFAAAPPSASGTTSGAAASAQDTSSAQRLSSDATTPGRADMAPPRADGGDGTDPSSAAARSTSSAPPSSTVRRSSTASTALAAPARDEITTTTLATVDEDAEETEGGAGWIFLVLAIMLVLAAVANTVGS